MSSAKTGLDIWALPLEGDRKPFPVAEQESWQVHAQVSPDSHWVAYTSGETGDSEVYVQDFPKLTKRQKVSTEGGQQPHWRNDSREMYYISRSGKIIAVSIGLGTRIEVGKPRELFSTNTPGGAWAITRRQFQPTPDGQKFIVRTVPDDAPLTPYIVTLNWTLGMKK